MISRIAAAVALVVLGVAVEDQFKGWWIGPSTYRVYLVGPLIDETTQRIFRGFERQHQFLAPTIAGVPVEIELIDDQGTPKGAAQASKLISDREDTLLVVGHVLSDDTLNAIPNYRSASPPVPLIATRETSPKVSEPCPQDTPCALVQMSPTDEDQARDLFRYANDKGKSRFAIVWGDDHNGYTKSLADLIAKQFTDQGKTAPDRYPRSQIPAHRFRDENYDCVFMVGEPGDAKALVRAIRDDLAGTQRPLPLILLSDAAFDQTLLTDDAGTAQLMEGVIITSQLGQGAGDQPYDTFGLDAFDIVNFMISKVNGAIIEGKVPFTFRLRKLLNMHRVADARWMLGSEIRKLNESGDRLIAGTREIYTFDRNGRRSNGRFHFHQINDSHFHDIDGPKDHPQRLNLAEGADQSNRPLQTVRLFPPVFSTSERISASTERVIIPRRDTR